MSASNRFRPFAAAACAAALVVSGSGMASAQGSLEGTGSSAVPVFDSPSTATLEATGEGAYTATYANRSAEDLACFGFVLPEDVAKDLYEETKNTDFSNPEFVEGDPEPELSEAEEALNGAMEAGHFAIMLGDEGGIGAREYYRLFLTYTWEQDEREYTEEELDEYVDMVLESGFLGGFDEVFGGQDFLNLVGAGDTATWSAVMPAGLPEGEAAGGVVVCFNGIDRDLVVAETTYVEIEHAEEGADAGELPSDGISGSIERTFGSAS